MKLFLISFTFLLFCKSGLTQTIKILEPVHFLALGDSYTIGQSVDETERWPAKFAFALSYRGFSVDEVKIIAQTGWRTDNLKDAINSQQPLNGFNLVSLLIGVNNQFQGRSVQDYAVEFEDLLKTAISLAGNSPEHVFVLSIPDYAFTPYGKGNPSISSEIDQFNQVNQTIAGKYLVKYIDITSISRQGLTRPELVASDGLHPSGIMYGLWVEEIVKNIEKELSINKEFQENDVVSCTLLKRQLTLGTRGENLDLRIYNTGGKILKNSVLRRNTQTTIDLGKLSAGMYFLVFRSDRNVVFRKKIILL